MGNSNRKQPGIAVDGVVIDEVEKEILLIKRRNPPFKDHYALPGGFVEYGETTEEACKREVFEETGIRVEIIKLVGVYSDPKRDPRGHVISIAYLCKPVDKKIKAGSDAKEAKWVKIEKLATIKLAFDHEKIIKDALSTMPTQ